MIFTKEKNFFVTEKTKGALSLSDAQALSNLCNQKAMSLKQKIENYNVCSEILDYSLTNSTTANAITRLIGNPFPEKQTLLGMHEKIATYHAFQAFLMEHVVLKDSLIKQLAKEKNNYTLTEQQVLTYESLVAPQLIHPVFVEVSMEDKLNNLSKEELLKFTIADSLAAHLGQFFHKNGKLDVSRKEVDNIKLVNYESLPNNGGTVIVHRGIHTSSEQLEEIHELYADKHRDAERIVNAIKTNMKNFATTRESELVDQYAKDRDAALAKYQIEMNAYKVEMEKYRLDVEKSKALHVEKYSKELMEAVRWKIEVPSIFKEIYEELSPKQQS